MSKPESALSIVIVGGGFCGVMTLVHLLRSSEKNLNITLINKGYPVAKGVAFQTYSDKHLLNVEARNLSAFPDEPDHFVDWCFRQKDVLADPRLLPTSYLPRNLLGKYLYETFNEATANIPDHITLSVVEEEATDIEKIKNSFIVKTTSGKKIVADKVLLATGNNEPGKPSKANEDLLKSKRYFSNPWNECAVDGLKDKETVLILGNGLTMVDVVQGLRVKNFNGKIIALSPHGYKILPHRKLPNQRYIIDELHPPYHLEKLFRFFYKHVREVKKRGMPGETVVDAMRARTQEFWQHLSLEDKKKFMMHIRHLWGVARHRLPPDVHEEIQGLINNNKLEVIAGRITHIDLRNEEINLKIRLRKDQSEQSLTIARIINCTGPETDIRKINNSLYHSIIKKGFIRSDPMNLGVLATSEGQVIDEHNIVSSQLFVIGSLLKGILWESTAIPELRVQAKKMAELLLKDSGKHTFDLKNGIKETPL
jgi:uncharacterized NAD(P)/FAD-binding protein YdhS